MKRRSGEFSVRVMRHAIGLDELFRESAGTALR